MKHNLHINYAPVAIDRSSTRILKHFFVQFMESLVRKHSGHIQTYPDPNRSFFIFLPFFWKISMILWRRFRRNVFPTAQQKFHFFIILEDRPKTWKICIRFLHVIQKSDTARFGLGALPGVGWNANNNRLVKNQYSGLSKTL